MKYKLLIVPFISFLLTVLLLGGCTESPFEGDISPEPIKITGYVNLLRDLEGDSTVYVWLEGFNLSTYTDNTGAFEIVIPREVSESSGNNLNGLYKLYFYVANYTVRTADVIVQNGKIVYGQGDVNKHGNLSHNIEMFKILDILTVVSPSRVDINYDGPIDVVLRLQAIVDSVTVIFPKSVGGLLGWLIFRNLETGEIYADIADIGADTQEYVGIGQESQSRRGVFQLNGTNFRELFLPIGEYKIIPFFYIHDEELPAELFASFGDVINKPNEAYLKIPFRRDGGHFRISE